ncbi:hypothetical protein QA600_14175 [Natronococcus sp. A-GB1]|uniref:hypothetical protein n=1 Tax=Natronococcus sp. A-GB1 TaxID=3037648 RepID=UPI00241CF0DC|nr:hypothetical protein [Natronococcus sp. A-GB1]MDG5760484.1 hypothetical protein [Natronococcus sp. A-GB1]
MRANNTDRLDNVDHDRSKPARIKLRSGELLEVEGYDTHDGWVVILESGQTGVIGKIPRENVAWIDRDGTTPVSELEAQTETSESSREIRADGGTIDTDWGLAGSEESAERDLFSREQRACDDPAEARAKEEEWLDRAEDCPGPERIDYLGESAAWMQRAEWLEADEEERKKMYRAHDRVDNIGLDPRW